jgi:hypothetical protein|tara:strand:+ start:276 stop:500 length:225 start_codon:yes stop_codon:yes gene_type:complete
MKIQIDTGDVEYSKLSRLLRFTVVCNIDSILAVEEAAGDTNMSMEEIAKEMGKKLERSILSDYTRRGISRARYD